MKSVVLDRLIESGEFSHHGSNYPIAHCISPTIGERYAQLIVDQKLKRAVEVGTLFGFSTLFLAGALAEIDGTLDTIDIRHHKRTWVDGQEICDIHEVAENLIEEANLSKYVTFHAGNSPDILAKLAASGKVYDFALVDGSHKFETVLLDVIGIDGMLADGGHIALDDIGASISGKPELSGGPNRVLNSLFSTGRYDIKLWSANTAVGQKLHARTVEPPVRRA